MKTRITAWCKDANEAKYLLALELIPETNMVQCKQFKDEVVTDQFIEDLNKKWRENQDIEFPEHSSSEKELSLSSSILPDGLSAEQEGDISVKVNEWNFMVLSTKLYQSYKSELDELKDRIERVEKFDKGIWENLKGFWSKVQEQLREKNLFREHGNMLKEVTNDLFSKLKDLRTQMDKEFNQESAKNKQSLYEEMEQIEAKITEGKRLQAVFEELKKIQQKLRNLKLNKEDRSKIWERIDKAFKEVKEKKFGSAGQPGASPLERLDKRYKGLLEAIKKMENSINRDKSDLEYQNRREARSDNQLEAQISIAKIAMIEERIRSKSEKLTEMNRTREDLEKRKVNLEAQAQKQQQEEDKKRLKKELDEKITSELEEKSKSSDPKLEKLAEAINEGKQKVKDLAEKAEEKLEELSEQVEEKLEAIGDVVEEKVDALEDKVEELAEDAKAKAKALIEKLKGEEASEESKEDEEA